MQNRDKRPASSGATVKLGAGMLAALGMIGRQSDDVLRAVVRPATSTRFIRHSVDDAAHHGLHGSLRAPAGRTLRSRADFHRLTFDDFLDETAAARGASHSQRVAPRPTFSRSTTENVIRELMETSIRSAADRAQRNDRDRRVVEADRGDCDG